MNGSFFISLLLLLTHMGATGNDFPNINRGEVIRQQAVNSLETAFLLKPLETESSGLAFQLAPLIFQECPASEGCATPLKPGTLTPSESGPRFAASASTIYWHMDTVELQGSPHARLAYIWFYPVAGLAETNQFVAQGVRITLDSNGRPSIWEILGKQSGTTILYVSNSFEQKARQEYGAPLPGAFHASDAGNTNTVIARLLEDAPVPMGPIVHVNSGGDMTSVICRCMPTQVNSLGGSGTYKLVPFAIAPPMRRSEISAPKSNDVAFWPGCDRNIGLDHHLRVPRQF